MPKTYKPKQSLTGLYPVPTNYVSQFAGKGRCPLLVYAHAPTYPLSNWSHNGS